MMLNRFMFDEKFNYTFAEVSEYLVNQTSSGAYQGYAFDSYALNELLSQVLGILQSGDNVFGLTFLAYVETNWVFTDLAITFMNKLSSRYHSHYCVALDNDSEKDTKFQDFFRKILNKLDYTYLKYSTLLNAYENQKTHLLDKLERTRSGERNIRQDGATSGTGARQGTSSESGSYLDLHNDTPQTTDVVATMEENQYVSDLKKGSSSASGTTGENSVESGETHSTGEDTFEENEAWDSMTNMARLDEIEKQFSNLWMKWLNEFDELFIEEVNF